MKLTLDSKTFIEAINWVTKNYDLKDSNAYVALKVDKDGNGYLFHSNPTTYLKSPFTLIDVEFNDDEAGKGVALALEGQYLQKLGSALSKVKGSISLSYAPAAGGKSALALKTPSGNFTLPLLTTKVASEPTVIPLGEVDDREYFDALLRLSKLCDPANAGYVPALGAVDIKLSSEDENLVMMATDRYALGEITIDFDPTDELDVFLEGRDNPNILLPFESANLINPSKGLTSTTTVVHEPKGQKFGYVFGDNRVAVFSLKDAEPLPYIRLKEGASSDLVNEVAVDTEELKRALQTVSSLAWEEDEIYLEMSKENGFIVRDSHGTNKVNVEYDSMTVDQDYTVKFVRQIITEGFHPVSTEKLNLKWKNEGVTYVFEPVLDNGDVMESTFVFFISST